MVNTDDDDDDDDDNNNDNNYLMTSSSSHQGFMCTIQNPFSHTEEVSGIMKQMWVELLTLYRKLTSR